MITNSLVTNANVVVLTLGAALFLCALVYYFHTRIINRSRQRLESERQRLSEAKINFFSNISDDLRTPLSLIISTVDKIIGEHRGEPLSKDLTQVENSARALMEEMDRILDFKQLADKTPAFHPSYGDIARFTAEVCRSYAEILESEGDVLTVDAGDRPVMTRFDRLMLRRVLHCILSYIYKHDRSDGALAIHVSVLQEDDKAVITISDNGKGFSDRTKRFIMDRIQKKEKRDIYDLTIGLDIVKEYVIRHGGEMAISDNHPSGSVCTFFIPIVKESKPIMGGGAAGGDGFAERTGKPLILNVNDNPAFRCFVTENLSSRYDIVEAVNGKEALELIADNSFDLILSDVAMPEMDGRELCRAIRSDIRYTNLPIILITNIQGEDAVLENLRAGADETMEKPFSIESLIIRIERLLKRNAPLVQDIDMAGHKISRADRELLDRITAEINANLQESEYTVEALCRAMNISRSGLYKKMMLLTGKSPIEYIRILRLEKGREMLENGETSVSQIAWSVGFSPKQFSKHFKDEYGCLPSEYIHHLTD